VAIAALIQKVNELEQHDRELRERIRVLEGQQKTAAEGQSATAPAAVAAAPPENQSQSQSQADGRELQRKLHNTSGIKWRGFGEATPRLRDIACH
jgi:hypothetical protein